jgi:hypothetical protein
MAEDEGDWSAMVGGAKGKARRRAAKKGGSALYGASEQRIRVTYQAAQEFKRDYSQTDKPKHYLRYITSLLLCLKNCADADLADDAKDTLKKILPLLDLNPFISFYLVLQPYRGLELGPLVSEELITCWMGTKCRNVPSDEKELVAAYLKFFDDDLMAVYKSANIDQSRVEEAVDRLRVEIDSKAPRDARGHIEAAYDKLQQTGMIGGMKALPEATLKCLTECQLAWLDTFRMMIGARFDTARRQKGPEEFQKMLEYIYCSMTGNDFERELTFLSEGVMKYNIGSRFDLLSLYKFMNSSDFLYRANASSQAGTASGTLDPSSDEIYNRNGYVMRWMGALAGAPSAAQASQKGRVRMLEP